MYKPPQLPSLIKCPYVFSRKQLRNSKRLISQESLSDGTDRGKLNKDRRVKWLTNEPTQNWEQAQEPVSKATSC